MKVFFRINEWNVCNRILFYLKKGATIIIDIELIGNSNNYVNIEKAKGQQLRKKYMNVFDCTLYAKNVF